MVYTYEITYHCADDDWLSWRVKSKDFHDACRAAFDRLYMAESDITCEQPEGPTARRAVAGSKLDGARLLRVERIEV